MVPAGYAQAFIGLEGAHQGPHTTYAGRRVDHFYIQDNTRRCRGTGYHCDLHHTPLCPPGGM